MKPDQTLLHYRVVDKLGEGGMGEVWRAVDTTLDRTVALKLLPGTFSEDPERLGRFEREAKSLAALNHPHIAGIYGFHRSGDERFIAMEFVDGEDLARRLERGALPLEEALSIATAVADALAAAHSGGVIHRDLKPANIVIDGEGTPKVLDFGLAKAIAPEGTSSGSASSAAELSPTVTSFGTVAGVILGTAAYMSPEQARGRPVDRRTDIWALGAVLYQMLTGRPPFGGETVTDTLASVLKSDPDWSALPPNTPPAVRRVLMRCLSRNPRHRIHDAADLRVELEHAFDDEMPGQPPVVRGSAWPGPLRIALGATALIAAALAGFLLRGDSGEVAAPAGKVVSSLLLPQGVRAELTELSVAISPEGERVAFVGIDEQEKSQIYVRNLDGRETRAIDGTADAITPFWSPDGREIGFHRHNQLMRVALDGGTLRVIADVVGRDGTWHPDGTILFSEDSRGTSLLEVSADGGTPEAVPGTGFGPSSHPLTPQFLPDGRHFIFQVEDRSGDRSGIYLARRGSTETTRLVDGLWNAAYAEGHLLYFRDDVLVAQPLDVGAARLTGEPFPVADTIVKLNYPFHGFFSVSSTGGRIALLEGTQTAGGAEAIWVDRAGAELERTGIVGDLYNPRLSADDRRLAIDVSTQETHGDIWIFDLARGSSRRLTSDPIDESHPLWSRDGSEIFFFRFPDLFRIEAGGSQEAVALQTSPHQKIPFDVSPDGRQMLFGESIDGQFDIFVREIESGDVKEWLASNRSETNAAFSPDGAWVAYESEENGQLEVYIDRFPLRGERFRISRDGGSWPVWGPDGKELYFYSSTRDLMIVTLDMDSDRDPVSPPDRLFSVSLRRSYFDVSADGQRFLIIAPIDPEVRALTLLQNWHQSASLP